MWGGLISGCVCGVGGGGVCGGWGGVGGGWGGLWAGCGEGGGGDVKKRGQRGGGREEGGVRDGRAKAERARHLQMMPGGRAD